MKIVKGYKLAEKRRRNERLYKFYKEHPNWTYKSIANLFQLSTKVCWTIINKEKKGHNETV